MGATKDIKLETNKGEQKIKNICMPEGADQEKFMQQMMADDAKNKARASYLVCLSPCVTAVAVAMPVATVAAVTVPLVNLCRRSFYGETLPDSGVAWLVDTERSLEARAEELAAAGQRIVWPRADALACHMAAYAVLKCEEVCVALSVVAKRV